MRHDERQICVRAVWGLLIALWATPLAAQATSIGGPVPGIRVTAPSPRITHDDRERPSNPQALYRRASNWKGAVLLGVIAGTAFGLAVATQDGDEGSDRPFSDRLSDGIVAGAIVAVPVTVIFAMLAGDGD